MVVMDIISRMPIYADVEIFEGRIRLIGTAKFIKESCSDWHKKEVKEICPGYEVITLRV